MATRGPTDTTGMLAAWNAGDAHALDRLMDLLCPKCGGSLTGSWNGGAGESLESAALASEAYLKLVRGADVTTVPPPAVGILPIPSVPLGEVGFEQARPLDSR